MGVLGFQMRDAANYLRDMANEGGHGAGSVFALTIQVLIVLTLVLFSIETIPDLSPKTRLILNRIELATLVVFSVEYAFRLWAAPNRIAFITSFFGIVDLLSIMPLFLPVSSDLRTVRIFRLLRLFRIFKFARYNAAMRRFQRAFMIAREELVLFSSFTAITLFLAAVGIYYFEHDAQPEVFSSIFSSLWWAVVTLTTVGYGDSYPITVGGKVFTFLILIVGLGIVAVPTGLVASALAEARLQDKVEAEVESPEVTK